MTDDDANLQKLSNVQSQLFTVEQLLGSQHSKQEQLTNEMLGFSTDLICELRLLSLVRSHIIRNKATEVESIVKSQFLKGLSFSALEYCPSFFESNMLNHYMTFISYLRTHTNILAQCLYYFSLSNPKKINTIAYSVFLTLFQQGWCLEEDSLLSDTLIAFASLQFNNDTRFDPGFKDDVIKPSLSNPIIILNDLEPLASFVTSYLFNGASLSYLQCSLSNVVNILLSLSSLRDMRNNFKTDLKSGKCASFMYWEVICEHAVICYDSLIRCMELLPSGVFSLFKYIKSTDTDNERCILLFFESFVNRALDNPAVLGLVPWHPGYAEWSPLHDVASVFRSKYCRFVPSTFQKPLKKVLSIIPSYQKIDVELFIEKLTSHVIGSSIISECELLSTNPSFPKELVITGRDICLLHSTALSYMDNLETPIDDSDLFIRIVRRLGNVPAINNLAHEHFRIVLQRQKEITAAAKRLRTKSLFSIDNSLTTITLSCDRDPFAEYFCDIIATLPSFEECINSLQPSNVSDFIKHIRILIPNFLPEKQLLQADAVLYFAMNTPSGSIDLIPRISTVTDLRHNRAMDAADRTSSIRTQHQRISSSLSIVEAMRSNVQGHILLNVSNELIRNELNAPFKAAMSKSTKILKSISKFNITLMELTEVAKKVTADFGLSQVHSAQIVRFLFFRMTDHITLRSYLSNDQIVWRRSVIISKIIESHFNELLENAIQPCKDAFNLRKKYLERAKDLLGHIKQNSGISVCLFYVVETIGLITELTTQCKQTLSFDSCILWILISSELKHVYGLGKFISHFLLGNSLLDTILSSNEIQHLGVFCSAVGMLLNNCKSFDQRIANF
ncbi:hypothetical protein TRFO_06578 [Tritrichomonas foetus]|uniref:Uncharacterized protein n=1 Tax=Tritrichomonas foetus TaxID=1144522 RepID=A0A1J4K1X4_9EUKA|nr:hypothetical protein TRFO_06578 [Tritrichomonas foetus]|eukprot:OHT03740.1 hypothetical protein TRFO_06578 [Tritrichomonas foetus]